MTLSLPKKLQNRSVVYARRKDFRILETGVLFLAFPYH